MMTTTVEELKSNFDKYLDEIMKGNEVKVMEGDKFIFKLQPSITVVRKCLEQSLNDEAKQEHNNNRQLGIGKGEFEITDEVNRLFSSENTGNRRPGIAKGKLQIPDDFDTWDKDTQEWIDSL